MNRIHRYEHSTNTARVVCAAGTAACTDTYCHFSAHNLLCSLARRSLSQYGPFRSVVHGGFPTPPQVCPSPFLTVAETAMARRRPAATRAGLKITLKGVV
jgi:hypothetical protein